jgi:Na+-transporting NADH:ubiquinone oxidoreductase subunit NqrA
VDKSKFRLIITFYCKDKQRNNSEKRRPQRPKTSSGSPSFLVLHVDKNPVLAETCAEVKKKSNLKQAGFMFLSGLQEKSRYLWQLIASQKSRKTTDYVAFTINQGQTNSGNVFRCKHLYLIPKYTKNSLI